jgi:AcrR family transcriptional regulator
MPATSTNKRERLVDAALDLAYRQGFRETSLADIAGEAAVPLGNVYYYFRTKEALGAALVERRSGQYAALRARWDELPDPRQRLLAFVAMTVANQDSLARSGCPIGSLCTELGKDGGAVAEQAGAIFGEMLVWLTEQFRAVRASTAPATAATPAAPATPATAATPADTADALHLLSATEGVSVLAHSLGSAELVSQEGARLATWINQLADAPPQGPTTHGDGTEGQA